jgi:hypothetical protein
MKYDQLKIIESMVAIQQKIFPTKKLQQRKMYE